MSVDVLVLAKAPVPGRVKTRLCPPCTPEQAAAVAAAALADTLDAVAGSAADRRVLVLEGDHLPPPSFTVRRQRGTGLADRIANACLDCSRPDAGAVLIGMDTPQVTPELLDLAAHRLSRADAVLGPAADGGWWALGLRDSRHGVALRDVPMSTPDTGDATLRVLRARGLRVALLPMLRDVDTAADAWAVARDCPRGRFGAAVAVHVRQPAEVPR